MLLGSYHSIKCTYVTAHKTAAMRRLLSFNFMNVSLWSENCSGNIVPMDTMVLMAQSATKNSENVQFLRSWPIRNFRVSLVQPTIWLEKKKTN